MTCGVNDQYRCVNEWMQAGLPKILCPSDVCRFGATPFAKTMPVTGGGPFDTRLR